MTGPGDDLLPLAVELAEAAGELLLDGLQRARSLVETKSTGTDMVTEIDRASEQLIVSALRSRRPDDGLLGEEGAASTGTSGLRWVIDPLDGTTNYLYGFPAFCVSIGVEDHDGSLVGVVRDPLHAETFTAVRGEGSWCNGRRLHIDPPSSLDFALVGTGFSYDRDNRRRQAEEVTQVIPHVRDIRRAGAAALDLCWVALGRLDCYFERGLQPWDWAAGSLIASEAGAAVETLPDGTRLAAPTALFDQFRSLVVGALRSPSTGG
jgi:myo-inositol-1(or 4)-monophosphatase